MNYDEALKNDKRTYTQYYISLLKTNHILIFAFVSSNDYSSKSIKICLFFFSFALYYTINVLFFTDTKIHGMYVEEGHYNFIYQIPQIIYSTIISSIINAIIRFFSLSQKVILKIKNESIEDKNLNDKKEKLIKFLRLKFLYFFKLSFVFLIFFWYYLSCFCAVYTNTQIHLFKDTLVSFGFSLVYPIGIYLIPGILRIYSLKNKNKKYIYSFSRLIQII